MSFLSRLIIAFLGLLISFSACAQPETLVFAVDVIRHGDRTPITDIASSPYPWPQGPGQLTATGMQQEFQLGMDMRKRYIEDSALLPAQYNAEALYVRSSDFDRTLMSAESLLMGLYPLGTGPMLPQTDTAALPSAYQPIPIHTIPQKEDTLLVADSLNRQQYKALLQKYVFASANWKKKLAELRPQFARWSQLTGMKITTLAELIRVGDALFIRQLHHVPLPTGMTEADEKTIIAARNWAFADLFRPRPLGQFTGRQLLSVIANYLKQAAQHPDKLKFVLFSSHDSTIMSVMSAMGTPMITETPRYASDLSFGLYKNEAGAFRVKVTLNGKAVQLPGCKEQDCELAQFNAFNNTAKVQ